MKTLPGDVARCSGRIDLLPDGQTCPHRDNWQRYLAVIGRDLQAGIDSYIGIPVMMATTHCQHKIEATHD